MKRGLFSVSYAGLWGQAYLELPRCIEKAAALGFDGVLFMAKPPHLDPLASAGPELERLARLLEDHGLAAVGLAAYTDFTLPAPAEIPVLAMQIGYVRACCRIASALGGDVVRVFTGYRYGEGDQEPASWNRVREALQRCGDAAEEHGVTIALQNHHDIAVGTEELALLLDEVGHPHVRAGYDAWSPFLRGEDLAAGARLMADRTVMTIAANYRRYPQYQYHPDCINYSRNFPDRVRATAMGEGEIDYRRFFSALRAADWTGWAVYEMCSPLIGGGSVENLDRHAAAFLAWMDLFEQEGTA